MTYHLNRNYCELLKENNEWLIILQIDVRVIIINSL